MKGEKNRQTVGNLSLNLWSLEEGTMWWTENRATKAIENIAAVNNFLNSTNEINFRFCIPHKHSLSLSQSSFWVTDSTLKIKAFLKTWLRKKNQVLKCVVICSDDVNQLISLRSFDELVAVRRTRRLQNRIVVFFGDSGNLDVCLSLYCGLVGFKNCLT
jgi:hypothetical protein